VTQVRSVEARQQALLAALPDLMFRLRRDGTYLEFAGDTTRLANRHEDLIGSNMYDVLPPQVAAAFHATVVEAIETRELCSVEYELRRLAGDVREFEARVVPVNGEEAIAIVRDVTEERMLVRELRASQRRAVEASDRERRRFERDLHDGAQQRLTTANLHLHVALRAVEEGGSLQIEAVRTAQRELEQGIREIRELVRGFQPPLLESNGLRAAIEDLVRRMSIPVELDVLCSARLPAMVERTLFFFVSEALANANKHSRASRIDVRIRQEGPLVRADVADDGIGGLEPTRGGGISGLHERLGAAGGTLEFESRAGEGTTLRAAVPLD
jgi:PAS domain S-box-containing protein